MDEGVGVAEVVEEFVAEAFALVGPGDQAGDIEKLDGYRAGALLTRAVVGLASAL